MTVKELKEQVAKLINQASQDNRIDIFCELSLNGKDPATYHYVHDKYGNPQFLSINEIPDGD